MALSLPWAFPGMGARQHLDEAFEAVFEARGFNALLFSIMVCLAVAALLLRVGRDSRGATLYRREAMAVVGLSWVMATVLGALPFYLSEVVRGPVVRVDTGSPDRMASARRGPQGVRINASPPIPPEKTCLPRCP